MSEPLKEYEVKKTIRAGRHMQLVDLNGTRKNFQSEFVVQSTAPGKSFKACVITQDQLDNGQMNFENSENGKYARRVKYQEDEHLNHFIAIRNADNSDTEIECSVVVRLKELPPNPTPKPPVQPDPVPEEFDNTPDVRDALISEDTRAELQQQLQELSETPNYRNADLPGMAENDDITIPQLPSRHQSSGLLSSLKWKWNGWVTIGIICLLLCAFMWWKRRSSDTSSHSSSSRSSRPSNHSKNSTHH